MKAWVATLLLVSCVGSVAARAVWRAESVPAPSGAEAMTGGGLDGDGFLPEPSEVPPSDQAPAEGDTVEGALPIVSEASFFGLLGFALGYLARKVVKLGLLLMAVFFAALQGLSYLGVVTVDWGRGIEVFSDLVMNLQENQTLGEILMDRIPTTGALAAGYWVGFRKG